jgi:TPR repeat protein
MKQKPFWSSRVYRAVYYWLENRIGPEAIVHGRNYESSWEYKQADLQSWDAEPDRKKLSDTLALCRVDPERAFTRLCELAEENSPVAINAIGERYYWGRVVPKDTVEGEAWFKRAYELGSQRGLLNYGKALFRRGGFEDAAAVFRNGVALDWAPAYYWLARAVASQSNPLKAPRLTRALLDRAAEMGSPAAKATLAAFTAAGFYGLRHIPRGIRLLKEALEAENLAKRRPTTNSSGQTLH